jgi:RNA polymerase sigma-54 factor
MLNQNLSQKLLQKLSPQQIQLMKLLQVPTAQLEQRIKEELEINPALEEPGTLDDGDYEESADDIQSSLDKEDEKPVEEDGVEKDSLQEIDFSDYYDDDEIASYKLKDNNYPDPDEERTLPVAMQNTFHEFLETQLGLLALDDREHKIADQIIGSIDDDGYLRRELDAICDDMAFAQNVMTDEDEVERILLQVQTFDPPGVGARDLQECLLIQLRRHETQDENVALAVQIITDQFEPFTKKHYEKLERALSITEDQLKSAIDVIIKLNPKPGSAYGGSSNNEQYLTPDFFITNTNGELQLTLNSRNAPELKISRSFKEMLQTYDQSKTKTKEQKDAVLFIKQKIDSAKWFIDAIQQRQQTLMKTMRTILEYQYDFFLTGDETTLRPMILKDIAERTSLDISTVSRVANSKYVQTEFGTFPLKYFFSESLQTDSGEEVSTREVKSILNDLISKESKKRPLSDQKLMEYLNKKGYNIARRTVAKYREQLNISVARLRKEL